MEKTTQAPKPTTKTLFEVWQGHRNGGTCAKEFNNWNDFREWYLASGVNLEDVAGVTELSKESLEKLPSNPTPPAETETQKDAGVPEDKAAPDGGAAQTESAASGDKAAQKSKNGK